MAYVVRTFFRRAISILAALTAFALAFSFLASWLPLADSVAHFRFHLSVALALTAVMLAIARAWRRAGLSLAVALAGFVGLGPALPDWGSAADARAPSLTVIQFNLSFRNRSPDAVADFIRREGADIVTLQEVTSRTHRVIELLAKDYPYGTHCPFSRRVGGVAVLSRLPKALGPSEGCSESRGLAWLRVMAETRPVSVASMHLHWPYPFGQEPQIDRLAEALRGIPRPVLVAGDFNAAPWSHAVDRIAQATDTTVARGLRFTFSIGTDGWTPSIAMPIDHILLPQGFLPADIRAGPGPGSDHRSIVARIALPPDPNPDREPGPLAKGPTAAN